MSFDNKIPTDEDFTGRAVNKHVLSEAIQHPTTIYPAALSLLGVAYMGLVSFDVTSLAVTAGIGAVSIISWIYHYFVRGEAVGQKYIQDLNERRAQLKIQQSDNVAEQCDAVNFREGAKQAGELKEAYVRLREFLKNKLEKQRVMTSQRFLTLAEDTYRQGLLLIDRALANHNILQKLDYYKLTREKQVFENEIKILQRENNPAKQPVIDALLTKTSSHDQRIALYMERKESLERLLAECEQLEAVLDTTYIKVVDLIDNEDGIGRSDVAGELERAVETARRVEEKLRNKLSPDNPDDDIYANYAKEHQKG